jgi:hypothetical protein
MEEKFFQVFLHTSQVHYMSACDMTDVKPIIHFRPHLVQHVKIDFSDDSDDSSSQLRQIVW